MGTGTIIFLIILAIIVIAGIIIYVFYKDSFMDFFNSLFDEDEDDTTDKDTNDSLFDEDDTNDKDTNDKYGDDISNVIKQDNGNNNQKDDKPKIIPLDIKDTCAVGTPTYIGTKHIYGLSDKTEIMKACQQDECFKNPGKCW